jgi:hypothetical protein
MTMRPQASLARHQRHPNTRGRWQCQGPWSEMLQAPACVSGRPRARAHSLLVPDPDCPLGVSQWLLLRSRPKSRASHHHSRAVASRTCLLSVNLRHPAELAQPVISFPGRSPHSLGTPMSTIGTLHLPCRGPPHETAQIRRTRLARMGAIRAVPRCRSCRATHLRQDSYNSNVAAATALPISTARAHVVGSRYLPSPGYQRISAKTTPRIPPTSGTTRISRGATRAVRQTRSPSVPTPTPPARSARGSTRGVPWRSFQHNPSTPVKGLLGVSQTCRLRARRHQGLRRSRLSTHQGRCSRVLIQLLSQQATT